MFSSSLLHFKGPLAISTFPSFDFRQGKAGELTIFSLRNLYLDKTCVVIWHYNLHKLPTHDCPTFVMMQSPHNGTYLLQSSGVLALIRRKKKIKWLSCVKQNGMYCINKLRNVKFFNMWYSEFEPNILLRRYVTLLQLIKLL